MVMSVDQGSLPETVPPGLVSEWRPGHVTTVVWTILGTATAVVGLFVYGSIALGRPLATNSWSISVNLFELALEIALIFGLGAIHEAVHGVVIIASGAKPQFGVLKLEGMPAGFYATAPGHRFGRRTYLLICFAPLVVLSPLGIPLCMLPFGVYLVVPFAVHLGGCIGDLTIALHVLRGPRDVVVEDLRDGMRIWRSAPQP
jgi:hypothetical protein